jgi:hypothetical protein
MKLKKKNQIKKLTKEKKGMSIKYERRKKYRGEIKKKKNKFRNYLKKIKRIKTISDRQNKLKKDANEKKNEK